MGIDFKGNSAFVSEKRSPQDHHFSNCNHRYNVPLSIRATRSTEFMMKAHTAMTPVRVA
jgi:hypothetical protein